MQIAFNQANERAAEESDRALQELYEALILEFGGWLQIGTTRCPEQSEQFQGEIRSLMEAPHFQVDGEWYVLDPHDSFRLVQWSVLHQYVEMRKRQQDEMDNCEACYFNRCYTHIIEPIIPEGVIPELLNEEQWFAKVLMLMRNQIEGTGGSV